MYSTVRNVESLWIIAVATFLFVIFVCAIICYLVLFPLGDGVGKKAGFGRDVAFVGLVYGILIIYAVIEFN